MVKEWLAIQRVGTWLGLSDSQLNDFVSEAQNIHQRSLEEERENYDFDSEYFRFLNMEVFSDSGLIRLLKRLDVSDQQVAQFHDGSVPVDQAFGSQSVVDYGLDELVDLVMLLKLVQEYQETIGTKTIKPLEKFYTLVYLVNHRISQEENPRISSHDTGLGMLERTGYRYSFTKQATYTSSESLTRDKDRLYAWSLLDQSLVSEPESNWNIPYQVGLGDAGEFFITRFTSKLKDFESVPLREWELCQTQIIEEYGEVSQTGLHDYLKSVEAFDQSTISDIVLNGRPKRFVSANEAERQRGVDIHV